MDYKITFEHLYDYIHECECDDTGIHIPNGFKDKFTLHVYSNKLQVNINRVTEPGDWGNSICAIRFDPDSRATGEPFQVYVYGSPRDGYCDYDVVHYVMSDETIDEFGWNIRDGKIVKGVLKDILTPYINQSK